MRAYQKTHPWLKFEVDLRHAPVSLWLLLGEARSKCEHLAGVPLRPDTAKHLHKVSLARGVLATTAIEGNTLTEEQVLKHLDGQLQLPKSQEYLATEIDNIIKALGRVWEDGRNRERGRLSTAQIKEFNRLVLANIHLDDGIVPGEFRGYSVGVGGYRGAPAEDCEFFVDKLCEWLNGSAFDASEEVGGITMAILKSVLAHLYLAWIHPFGDGNGRTARLVEFKLLVDAGVPTPAAHLLSNHYNQTRSEYYRQLDQASKSGGDVVPFIVYAVQGFVDQIRAQLVEVRGQQLDVAWRNYVHERFQSRNSKADVRRRHLMLDLSKKVKPIPLTELSSISPRIAAAYAKKTAKTLTRDVNDLQSMGLLHKGKDGVRAKKEIILAFLPRSATETGMVDILTTNMTDLLEQLAQGSSPSIVVQVS